MARSVHQDAQDSTAQNRGITLALLVSLLIHTPLFLMTGGWRVGPQHGRMQPPLEVRIEASEAPVAKVDTPKVDTPRKAAPLETEVLAPLAIGPRRVSEPHDLPEASVTALHLESAATETDTDAAPDEITPAAPPSAEEPVTPTDTVVATVAVAPAEETMLARRLVREARELLESHSLSRDVTFDSGHRRFAAALTRQPASDEMGVEHVTVEITAEHGGERLQTSMQMKRLAFSHFTQLVDRWDESVQLHDDEIVGRFHSNSEIFIAYDRKVAPRLLGKVTTARGIRVTDEGGRRSRREIFAGGLETRSARIRLPGISLPVASEHRPWNADVHLVQGNTLIVFHADGAYDCVELASSAAARRRLAPDRPTYIIGSSDTELHVRGVINGLVTVYSPERIVIQGNLTYARDPRAVDGADAYLGLVSDGNIEIDIAEVTGPGDLVVHAAVYARKRFMVRNPRGRGPALLLIYGSLTAGSLSETEPRYATRIEFDPRFERVRPPGFPETDRYEIDTWDGRWRATYPQ